MFQYVSFKTFYYESFLGFQTSHIYLYIVVYFCSFLFLAVVRFVAHEPRINHYFLFVFVFLIGLPPMPMFFVKLSVLSYFYKYVNVGAFFVLLLLFVFL